MAARAHQETTLAIWRLAVLPGGAGGAGRRKRLACERGVAVRRRRRLARSQSGTTSAQRSCRLSTERWRSRGTSSGVLLLQPSGPLGRRAVWTTPSPPRSRQRHGATWNDLTTCPWGLCSPSQASVDAWSCCHLSWTWLLLLSGARRANAGALSSGCGRNRQIGWRRRAARSTPSSRPACRYSAGTAPGPLDHSQNKWR